MIRKGWLAGLAVVLTAWPCSAQFGGMGGMGGGMGGMGGGMGGMGGGMGMVRMGMSPQPLETWSVRFETFDGQNVTGKLRVPSVSVACSLGLYEIKPGKIKTIELKPVGEPIMFGAQGAQREGEILTDSGEKVVGRVNVPDWKVETDLGTLTPDAKHLKTMTFIARLDGPKPEPEPARAAQPNGQAKPEQ